MRLVIVIAITFLLNVVTPVYAQVKLGERESLLNNDKVEVLRLFYPAGSESGMHTHIHPNRVVYVLSGGTLELVPSDPEKTSRVVELLSGQVLFLPATTHNVRNIGASEVILLETEIK